MCDAEGDATSREPIEGPARERLDAEKVAYWYFRLNGFPQIENFVVHPKRRGSRGRRLICLQSALTIRWSDIWLIAACGSKWGSDVPSAFWLTISMLDARRCFRCRLRSAAGALRPRPHRRGRLG